MSGRVPSNFLSPVTVARVAYDETLPPGRRKDSRSRARKGTYQPRVLLNLAWSMATMRPSVAFLLEGWMEFIPSSWAACLRFFASTRRDSQLDEVSEMAIPHATPGQVIDVAPLGAAISTAVTTTLVKTARLEILRLVVPAGKEIPPHRVAGEITVQCLEGRIAFTSSGATRELRSGQMCYLAGGTEHAIKGMEDATVLLTILL